jgi:DNA-binding CsgD family transcriptional regulator
MKEYRLEIKVRNNAVLKRIEELGYESLPAFCREHKLHYNVVNHIISFKAPFYGKRGNINGSIIKLANALQVLPDYIYPPERRGEPLQNNKYIAEVEKADLMQVSTSLRMDAMPVDDRKMLNDLAPTIRNVMLEALTPREHRLIDKRFGLTSGTPETLDEVGDQLNVSRERIRQMEAKALRKMKHPSRSRKLREYIEFLDELNVR